jgi:hypothetical protein
MLNNLPSGHENEIFIDDVALHHGIKLFDMNSEHDRIPSYHELEADKWRGFHVKLPIFERNAPIKSTKETLLAITTYRNKILKFFKYLESDVDNT